MSSEFNVLFWPRYPMSAEGRIGFILAVTGDFLRIL